MSNLFQRCQLEGNALDAKVAELEGVTTILGRDGYLWDMGGMKYSPSTDWRHGGPIIERDHIFLQPPSEEHVHGGPNAGWNRYNFWRATVSSATRQRPNPSGSTLAPLTVGRGAGETALIAAMRAYVDSKETS